MPAHAFSDCTVCCCVAPLVSIGHRQQAAAMTYHQPVHALVDTLAINGRTSNDAPAPIPQVTELQSLGNIACALGARLVLLVGEDQQRGVSKFFLIQHGCQLIGGRAQSLNIRGVDDEDDSGGIGVVATPVWTDGCLATQILPWLKRATRLDSVFPLHGMNHLSDHRVRGMVAMTAGTHPDVEIEILICDGLDVEADGRYRGDDLADLVNSSAIKGRICACCPGRTDF